MHLVVVGLSHKTAPLALREKFVVTPEEGTQLLSSLAQSADIQEALLLSTCNRTELYLVAKHRERAEEKGNAFFGAADKTLLYCHSNQEAVGHLFRVAASLDSMIIGEPQITGQVKEAYRQAVAAQATGPYLNRLIHRSFETAKRVRTETEISLRPVSVSYAAVILAEKIFGDLSEKKVLLVGAGEMAELAAEHFVKRKIRTLGLCNRTEEKASLLAKRFQGGVVPFDRLAEAVSDYDVIVTSASVNSFLITPEIVSQAMERRKGSPLFLIDIGLPRNVAPEVNSLFNVYLYDLDDLQGLVVEGLAARQKEAKKAETIIEGEVHRFMKSLLEREVSPTIAQLSQKIESIRQTEVQKMMASLGPVSPEMREVIEAGTRAIVNKVLHEPVTRLKAEEVENEGLSSADVLRRLFKLPL
ncbi:MAG: glutamyl-tRNA reductase [Deltaproteobacteria bacterium]|nr:glutamyl-tRNA reductase [Deltaproteobacteria bacterium]